jgi:hypothetical protein
MLRARTPLRLVLADRPTFVGTFVRVIEVWTDKALRLLRAGARLP